MSTVRVSQAATVRDVPVVSLSPHRLLSDGAAVGSFNTSTKGAEALGDRVAPLHDQRAIVAPTSGVQRTPELADTFRSSVPLRGYDFGRVRIHASPSAGSDVARPGAGGLTPQRVPDSVQAAINSTSRPLPAALRLQAEAFFATNLGHVRLHDDAPARRAAAQSRARGLAVGPHILLSRRMGDLAPDTARHTLAHEIAHTLQRQTDANATCFEVDDGDAERAARGAADAFVGGTCRLCATGALRARRGVARERDPRLDDLVHVIESLPHVLTDEAVAEELNRSAPGLDLNDPDNAEPLVLLLDDSWLAGSGRRILDYWQALQAGGLPAGTEERPSNPTAGVATAAAPAPAVVATPPRSMSGTAIRAEIDSVRAELDMPPLVEDAPSSESFVPQSADERSLLARLEALEAEYYRRRTVLEASREFTAVEAARPRSSVDIGDAARVATTVATNPAMLPVEGVSALLGHPVEDFATGFLPGFLGGAVLELPADTFQRLDAETRAHPIQFNGGVMAGIPVGAVQGLWDMLVGLVDLLGLALDLSPIGRAWHQMQDVYRMATDPEGHQADQSRRWEQARAVGEAIVALVTELLTDPAFMIRHGRELGEIAGRSAADWFNSDFMRRSTFDKGFLVGRVEGRIVFEIVALFVGPEVWIARGATAVGELARLSAPLRRAIIEAIEHVPVLRRLLQSSREASFAAREAVSAERAMIGGGEALADASRARDVAADLGRSGRVADEGGLAPAASGAEPVPVLEAPGAVAHEVPPTASTAEPSEVVGSAEPAAAAARSDPAVGPAAPETAPPLPAPRPVPHAIGGDLAARVDRAIELAPRSAPYRARLLTLRDQLRRAQRTLADRRRRITAEGVEAVEQEFARIADDIAADGEAAGNRAVADALRGELRPTTSSNVADVMVEASGGTSGGAAVDPRGPASRVVDEGMPTAETDPTARGAGRAARRALRASTGAAPSGSQLHHLVPLELREHSAVYEYERRIARIDNPRATASIGERWINQPTNALPMPSDPAAAGASGLTIHRGSHPRYTAWMENQLDQLWYEYSRLGGLTLEEFGRRFEMLVGRAEVRLGSGAWGPRVN